MPSIVFLIFKNKKYLTEFIKNTAIEIGFDACGIATSELLDEDKAFLAQWLADGFQGEMSYLERNFEKRVDPRAMVEGCKSVIVTLLNYYPHERQREDVPKISKYAYSKVDYHTIIKEKLMQLEARIVERYGEACFNASQQHRFVDSAPVLERRWAQRAGLGWIGKNKMLINPRLGSFCFIGVLMINVELEYDTPMPDRCGNCRRCLDTCPTQALTEKRGLDARRCISYQTIEKKTAVDDTIRPKLNGWFCGCDICNDVCPWNKTKAKPTLCRDFEPVDGVLTWTSNEWEKMDKPLFKQMFRHSAIQRAGFEKLKQNLVFVASRSTSDMVEKQETNDA